MKKEKFILMFIVCSLSLTAFAQDKYGEKIKVKEKKVIGADNRYQIKIDNGEKTYQIVGALEFTNKKPCTASLVSNIHIITAAHCVTDEAKKVLLKPSELLFVPGRKAAKHSPFGIFKIAKISTSKKYVLEKNADWDVAILTLDRPANLGFFTLREMPSQRVLSASNIYITGYPSDKENRTMWEASSLGTIMGKINTFHHLADTFAGNSGSVVRIKIQGQDYAIGVHTGYSGLMNRGVAFNEEILEAIERWMN